MVKGVIHSSPWASPDYKLYITGRDADPSIWLKGREVADTIALDTMDFASKSDEELLALFGHPMPKVRVRPSGRSGRGSTS